GRAPCHSRRRCQVVVPAALQSRPQSDRAGLCQAQDPAAKGRRKNRRSHLETDWRTPVSLRPTGMRQLLQKRRIRVNLNGSDSSLLYCKRHLLKVVELKSSFVVSGTELTG